MALDVEKIYNPTLREWMQEHLEYAARLVYLGTPIVDDDDRIVVSTNMKVGTYTKAANPDVPRTISVTVTAVTGADTMGTIALVGTDIANNVISETVTPVADSTVYSTKAFKTITSVTGAGWVINTGNDTIKVGVGPKLGLPFQIDATTNCRIGIVGTAFIAATTTASPDVAKSTVDVSSGTYDGSKPVYALVVE